MHFENLDAGFLKQYMQCTFEDAKLDYKREWISTLEKKQLV